MKMRKIVHISNFQKKQIIIFFGPFTKKKFQKKYKSHKKSLDRSMTPILNGIAIKYRPIYLYIQALKKKIRRRFGEILILKFSNFTINGKIL